MKKTVVEGLPAYIIEHISNLENKLELKDVELGSKDAQLEKKDAQIARLTEMLLIAQKARFGSTSEKAKYVLADDLAQETLFNEAEVYANEDEPEPTIVESHTRKPKRTKDELAKDLPVKETVIDIPEDERVCNICEGDLHKIGRELVRRELNFIPAQSYLEEIYSINYGCGDCLKETDEANIIKPEVPEPVVKRGLASPSSVAYTMYQKYCNAMPLNRQAKDWANFGLIIARATLANWVIYTSTRWLFPLWMALKAVLLTSPIILADESTFQVLKEPGKTPQSKSQMWVYCTGRVARPPPIVLFEYQPSRAGEHPKAFLEGAENFYLQTDGWSAYNKVENAIHCGCFAHQRRKFEEAMPKNAPRDNHARIGFEFCQKLFKLERKFEELTPERRFEMRLEQSKPVLDNFFEWAESVNYLSGSKLAEAIVYAINQKKELSAFLLDGRLEISTNRIENMIRPYAVGRRNWLFADTVEGAQSSAVVYSIVRTAEANGLNPYHYLLYLLTRLPAILAKNPEADLSPFFPWENEVQKHCRHANGKRGKLNTLR